MKEITRRMGEVWKTLFNHLEVVLLVLVSSLQNGRISIFRNINMESRWALKCWRQCLVKHRTTSGAGLLYLCFLGGTVFWPLGFCFMTPSPSKNTILRSATIAITSWQKKHFASFGGFDWSKTISVFESGSVLTLIVDGRNPVPPGMFKTL